MSQRPRNKTRSHRLGLVGGTHGRTWCKMEWYVPFVNGHAIIYHGHTDADDHSECGPQIFCCPKAARLLRNRHPKAIPGHAEWEFTEGEYLASWMGEIGPKVYYVFFCDPQDQTLLRFCGVRTPEVQDVLLKQITLDRYLEHADKIFPIERCWQRRDVQPHD